MNQRSNAQIQAAAALAFPELREGKVERMTGGISNHLFRVSREGCTTVLVRFYGATLPGCDRAFEEELVSALSDKNFSPRVFATFPGGRVEEFWAGWRAALPSEAMQTSPVDILSMTAARTAEFHGLQLDLTRKVSYVEQMHQWLGMLEAGGPLDIDELRSEFAQIAGLRPKPSNDAEATLSSLLLQKQLCHMDLFASNLLLSPSLDELRIIDFEYGAQAPAGMDIGNHFSGCTELIEGEVVTFDVNFFPSRENQVSFLRQYLAGRGFALDDASVEYGLRLLMALTAEAELRWVVWGLLQLQLSTVSFDYADYAKQRWACFRTYKQWVQ